jgi:GalNAc-alpha-(1->4)-GalNAc-alpha-(1->3)-diNAcBac-PP-undecaprenol alpha-1,4-N-acetyl-D-galactosaminyltransferase
MKVFLVIPTLTAGGAERVVSILANEWVLKPNVNVHLVLLSEGEIFYEIDSRVIIHELNLGVGLPIYKKPFSLFLLLIEFRKFVKDEQPDFVLSFMNKYNVFVLISLFNSRIKTFVSERDSPTEKIPFLTLFLRFITYKFADGIITQTQFSKDYLVNIIKNQKVVVIPNPLSKTFINRAVVKEKIIINVGRLVEKKGQKYLIEAFSKLNSKGWKLVFLGDGHLRSELEKMICNLKISDKVFFIGTTKNIGEWLNKSSIFAFPSILEGFPNALAEAMSYGLPCVSFDCKTGPSDLINNGVNGFLVEEKDVQSFTEKIQILIEDDVLRAKLSAEAQKISLRLDSKIISDEYFNYCINR